MLRIKRFLEYRKCSCCKQEYLAYQVEKINKNNDYICSECRRSNGYYVKNNSFKGKKTQISFSFEFETGSRAKALYELRKHKFIACSDTSIRGLEWKSEIYYNKKSFHAICRKIEKFAKYVDGHCGTHLHVSTPYKQKIKEYEHELFEPILNVMTSDRNSTVKFWGRYFTQYCMPSIQEGRYNTFNPRSSVDTLEFRLLKFINANQYIRACDFCIDTTKYINHFIGREDFNREKAKQIGQTIANKYKEVIQNVQTSTNE